MVCYHSAMFTRLIKYIIQKNKKIILTLCELECYLSSQWASNAHKRLLFAQWMIPPNPEFFDHNIDLFFQWRKNRMPFWLERGVFGCLAINNGDNVLELACGDGFNARNFYSIRANKIIACDFDQNAINTCIKKNSAENVKYVLQDIRKALPKGKFNVIIWDAAIEHFTENEIDKIMKKIKTSLVQNGILSGYTLVEKIGGKHLPQHEYEFKNKEDLARFFRPYFKNVKVFETIYPTRHNLYFWASDGKIPFG